MPVNHMQDFQECKMDRIKQTLHPKTAKELKVEGISCGKSSCSYQSSKRSGEARSTGSIQVSEVLTRS